jgi:PilZ domain-containing protein
MSNSGERRTKAPRLKVFLRATIDVEGHPPRTCIVIDLSDTGARLALDDANAIPNFFVLIIPTRKLQRDCVLIHRHGDDTIGVQFLEKKPWWSSLAIFAPTGTGSLIRFVRLVRQFFEHVSNLAFDRQQRSVDLQKSISIQHSEAIVSAFIEHPAESN